MRFIYVIFLCEHRTYFSIYRMSRGMPKIKAAGALVYSILPCAILVAPHCTRTFITLALWRPIVRYASHMNLMWNFLFSFLSHFFFVVVACAEQCRETVTIFRGFTIVHYVIFLLPYEWMCDKRASSFAPHINYILTTNSIKIVRWLGCVMEDGGLLALLTCNI